MVTDYNARIVYIVLSAIWRPVRDCIVGRITIQQACDFFVQKANDFYKNYGIEYATLFCQMSEAAIDFLDGNYKEGLHGLQKRRRNQM